VDERLLGREEQERGQGGEMGCGRAVRGNGGVRIDGGVGAGREEGEVGVEVLGGHGARRTPYGRISE